MPEKKKPPLAIGYTSDKNGVHFGWSIKGRREIPYGIPVYDRASSDLWEGQGVLPKKVHDEAVAFLNGPLSADLKIPEGYPYEFYEPEREDPTYTGRLRENRERRRRT